MKNILLALSLVTLIGVSNALVMFPVHLSAAELGGNAIKVYCNGCPEKTVNEKFVDELTTEDVGVVVVWHPTTNTPHRIIITSTSASPVQDVCDTFKKYYPTLATTITTHIGGISQYRCDTHSTGPTSLDVVGGPASLEVAQP